MTISYVGPNYLTCDSVDTKPSTLPDNYIAYEVDTDIAFISLSGVWNPLTSSKSGISTQSGNGVTTVFTIAHGAPTTPTTPIVTPGSADTAEQPFYVTVGATNITVTYLTAPDSGTNNLKFNITEFIVSDNKVVLEYSANLDWKSIVNVIEKFEFENGLVKKSGAYYGFEQATH